jgi:hypothetical protein
MVKCSRRIRATVSTTSIPDPRFESKREAYNGHTSAQGGHFWTPIPRIRGPTRQHMVRQARSEDAGEPDPLRAGRMGWNGSHDKQARHRVCLIDLARCGIFGRHVVELCRSRARLKPFPNLRVLVARESRDNRSLAPPSCQGATRRARSPVHACGRPPGRRQTGMSLNSTSLTAFQSRSRNPTISASSARRREVPAGSADSLRLRPGVSLRQIIRQVSKNWSR